MTAVASNLYCIVALIVWWGPSDWLPTVTDAGGWMIMAVAVFFRLVSIDQKRDKH